MPLMTMEDREMAKEAPLFFKRSMEMISYSQQPRPNALKGQLEIPS